MTEAANTAKANAPNSANVTSATNVPKESSVEWTQLGGDSSYLNSDLFGGDLFGDELIDMYSSPVVEGSEPDIVKSSKPEGENKGVSPMNEEPLGFGNLRSSSSLNDFSSLFPTSVDPGSLATLDVNAPMDPATAAALQVAGVTNKLAPLKAPDAGSSAMRVVSDASNTSSISAPVSHSTQANSYGASSIQNQGGLTSEKVANSAARKRKDAPTQKLRPDVSVNPPVPALHTGPLPPFRNEAVAGAVVKKAEGGVTTSVIAERIGRNGVFHQVKPFAKPSIPVVKRQRKNGAASKKASAVNKKAANAKAVAQFAPLAASQVSKITNRGPSKCTNAPVVTGTQTVANPLSYSSGGAGQGANVQVSSTASTAVRPNSPPNPVSNNVSKEPSPALISPGSLHGAVAPSTLTSADDINAAVAAVALAKANALLSTAKNAAALNVQQSGPKVPALPTFESKNIDASKTSIPVSVPSAPQTFVNSSTETPCPVTSSNLQGQSTSTDCIATPLGSLTSSTVPCGNQAESMAAVTESVASFEGLSDSSLLDSALSQAQKRRAALTPEDRAKQNRDRNREHARNTRLRKKAYVEELKKTLTEIVAQRDALELEKGTEKQRENECRSVRFTVMEEFLKLRGCNVQDAARWKAILEEGFCLTLPKTSYRKMVSPLPSVNAPTSKNLPPTTGLTSVPAVPLSVSVQRPTFSFAQTIKGVQMNMEDASLMSEMVAGIGRSANGPYISMSYELHRDRFIMDSSNHTAIVDWTARTFGAKAHGAAYELAVTGNMRAVFHSATNKLLSVDLSFDTGAVSSQLQSLYSCSFHDDNKYNDADATAALLDSLNVPQLEGLIDSTADSVNSSHHVSVSSDEHNESDCCSEGVYTEEEGVTRKRSVQIL